MKPATARTLAVLALLLAAGYLLRGTLAAISWSCLIAVSTWPLHDRLQRFVPQRGRAISAGLLTAAAIVLLLLPVVYLIYHGLREMPALVRFWATSNEAGVPAPAWLLHLPFIGEWASGQWNAQIAEPGALADFVHGLGSRLNFQTGRGLVIRLGHRAMAIFFCIFVLFFLYLRGDLIASQCEAIVSRYLQEPGVHAMRLAVQAVRGTVNGLIFVGLGVAVVMSIAYAVAGVPHPAFWGLVTGLFGIVPFGAVLALAVVSVYLLALEAHAAAIGIFVFGAILIFVVDHFVRPLFIAGSSKVPVVLALLGIVGGLETFGILGLFVGPALMAVLVAVWRDLASERTVVR